MGRELIRSAKAILTIDTNNRSERVVLSMEDGETLVEFVERIEAWYARFDDDE